MFVKRNRSRPSLRAREVEDDGPTGSPLAQSSFGPDDNADESKSGSTSAQEADEGGSVMERKKAKAKERKGGSGKSSRLSFGIDPSEDGSSGEGSSTPFRAKKSLLSQSFKPTAETPSPSLGGNGRTYSSEYLSELKAATPSRAPVSVRDVIDGADEDEEMDEGSGLTRLAREKYGASIVEDTTAGIPDTAAIAAAKLKRQAKVESGKHDLGEDYISLGAGQVAVYDGEKGPHPESRLMREDDEFGEGDDELADYTEANDKVFLGKKANKAAARRLRGEMGEMIEDREAESEDDEDTREWEEAQVRRAGRVEQEKLERTIKQGYVPTAMPSARPVPTLGPAQARLAKSLADMRVTQSEASHNLEATAKELNNLEEQEKMLREEVEKVEGKREWVEGFRIWVETLGKFLEEKVPKLDDIEADSIHHISERRDLTTKRRTGDVSDDLSLFLGSAPSTETAEVDELGRSREMEAGPSSAVRRARRSERDARRIRRKVRSQGRAQPPKENEEGFSTDSTLADGDAEDYRSAQRNLSRRVHGLLEDVKAEDFRDPRLGLAKRFGDWRRRYEEEYVNAFGGLALVQAWEFWVRGELIGWDPLRDNTPLESFTWFTALHEYARPPPHHPDGAPIDDMDMDEDEHPLGPDGDLVADMVSKTVVPLLVKMFEAGAYDPYSTPQTRRAIDLADVVQELTGKDSRKFTSLLRAVLGVFHNEVQSLIAAVSACLIPGAISPPAFDPASRTAMSRFVQKIIKLIRNISLWRRSVPSEVKQLVDQVVGEVLRPVLTKTWEVGGKEMAGKVLASVGNELRPDLAAFLRNGPGPAARTW